MFISSSLIAASGLFSVASCAPAARQDDGGFVTTSGDSFQLDGDEFIFAGSNAYYFPFSGVRNFLTLYRVLS